MTDVAHGAMGRLSLSCRGHGNWRYGECLMNRLTTALFLSSSIMGVAY